MSEQIPAPAGQSTADPDATGGPVVTGGHPTKATGTTPSDVVDLGLVYGVTVDAQNHAIIDMTLTSAACPLTDVIEDQTAQALEDVVSGHRINWVWMPPWGPDKITDDGREQLRALGFNI